MGSSVVNDIDSRVCAWHIVSALASLCSPFYCLIGEFDEGAGRVSFYIGVHTRRVWIEMLNI